MPPSASVTSPAEIRQITISPKLHPKDDHELTTQKCVGLHFVLLTHFTPLGTTTHDEWITDLTYHFQM